VSQEYFVEIAATAEADVLAIRDYIAEDNPAAATRWMHAFREQVQSLRTLPRRGVIIHEAEFLDVRYRHLLHYDYRTIYRIDREHVLIVRVLHGARLLDGLL
jgi:toxin ParE1/3/4